MNLDLSTSHGLMIGLLPELVLTGWALVLLAVVAWRHKTPGDLRVAGWITLVAFATSAAAVWWLWWNRAGSDGITPMVAVDDFRYVSDWLFLGAGALTVMFSFAYLERESLLAPEYYVLLIFATIGMMLMAGGEDLIVIFLGLELMSVCVYVLAGVDRKSARAAEAALKYFLLGAFASAFLLYGIALAYGATGTTNLTLIGMQIGTLGLAHSPLLLLGLGLLLVGFGFKTAAVPFHMWAPDVYDGAPTPVTGFMATAVKAAAFVALARVLVEAFAFTPAWHSIVTGLAVATMIVGNLVALAQRSLKRMLAYSSVAHAGYLLVAVAAGSPAGNAAVLFYLAAYGLTTVAAFALVAARGRGGESDLQIDDLAGLSQDKPWLAFALAVCMLSLLGFPATAGFIGKWYILLAAIGAGKGWLATVLVLTSIISAGYYLPVIMAMYMRPVPFANAHAGLKFSRLGLAALTLCIAAVLYFGIQPRQLLSLAKDSGAAIHPAATATPAAGN